MILHTYTLECTQQTLVSDTHMHTLFNSLKIGKTQQLSAVLPDRFTVGDIHLLTIPQEIHEITNNIKYVHDCFIASFVKVHI